MARMHPGTDAWLESIGANEAKDKLQAAMESVKAKAVRDGVTYKNDNEGENMSEQTENTEVEDVKAENTEVEDVKAENTEVEDVEAESTEVEDVKAESTEAESTEVEDVKAESTEVESTEVEDVKAESIEVEDVLKAVTDLAEFVGTNLGDIAEVFTKLQDRVTALETELAEAKSKAVKQVDSFMLPAMSFAAMVKEESSVDTGESLLGDIDVASLLKEAPEETEATENVGSPPLFAF